MALQIKGAISQPMIKQYPNKFAPNWPNAVMPVSAWTVLNIGDVHRSTL